MRLGGPAPVDAILGAYTIAPFDDCGGHVNLNAGYHGHAVSDCFDERPLGLDAPVIGISMDGHVIATHLAALTDLDACNGHALAEGPYHYHAGDIGSNEILGCLVAQTGRSSTDPDAVCDASAQPRRARP